MQWRPLTIFLSERYYSKDNKIIFCSPVGGLGAEIFNFDGSEFFQTLSKSLQTLKVNISTSRPPTEDCQTILEMAGQWQSNETGPTSLLALPAS